MSQRRNGLGPSMSEKEIEEARKKQEQRQRRQQDEQTARTVAQSAATQQGTAAPGYWDMLGDPDLDDPAWGDSLEAFTSGALSRAFALGNISRAEWQDMQLRIENEFWQIQNEMQQEHMADDDMRLMYGGSRPDLDDAEARRLREAREVKKNLTSLSVDARGLRSGTEIHAVARTEDGEGDEDASGLLASVGGYLSG
jgi:hypothetical protein